MCFSCSAAEVSILLPHRHLSGGYLLLCRGTFPGNFPADQVHAPQYLRLFRNPSPSSFGKLTMLTFPIKLSATRDEIFKAISADTFYEYFEEVIKGDKSNNNYSSAILANNNTEYPHQTLDKATVNIHEDMIEAMTMIEALENYRRMIEKHDACSKEVYRRDLETCSMCQYLLHRLSQRFDDLAKLLHQIGTNGCLDAPLSKVFLNSLTQARGWLQILREVVLEF